MSDILEVIDAAAQSKDWLVLGIASVVLVVPIVLKALGKRVPLVDAAAEFVVGILKARKKPLPEPKPGEPSGIAAVVPVKDAVEKPKPAEELK